MKSFTGIIVPALVTVALGGAAVWHYLHLASPAHALAGVDASLSVAGDCAGLRAAAEDWLRRMPGIRAESSFGVLVMGSEARDPEPDLGFTVPVPTVPDIVFGRTKKLREYEAAMKDLFGQLQESCETTGPGRHSPIHALVLYGVAHLKSLGCGPERRCYFLIKTDLEEDVEPALRAALAQAASDAHVTVPSELAGSINNAGIALTFCGTAQSAPRRDERLVSPAASRERIWRALFTQPDLVSFESYCN